MNNVKFTAIVSLLVICAQVFSQNKQVFPTKTKNGKNGIIDTRIDNLRYWKQKAAEGVIPYNPKVDIPKGKFTSSKIKAFSVVTEDSPDVPVTSESSTQSENSVFIDPSNPDFVMNSNNSTSWSGSSVGSLYGANYFYSDDASFTWGGQLEGAGGANSGDPTSAISLDGRMYVGFIHSNGGQGVSYSTDGGLTWTSVQAGTPPGGYNILDKNHLWIDNSPTSPYQGNVYNAWTAFGNTNDSDIELVYSDDGGLTYSSHMNISSAVSAGSHNQGVNLQTGPNGNVYAVWAIYDSWPSAETAFGMAKSTDGGQTFDPATRILTNIKGIREYSAFTKNHRVNSFPVMAVDISGGEYNGNIYIVWSNIGVPGTNTGSNVSVYMIKSEDEGTTWSTPTRVNQGPADDGKVAYFPWVTCDPETGTLSVVFYDDRNVSSSNCETWAANSYDGGDTWEDFKVSDVSFTPNAIAGLAGGYMGDYLGIAARGSKVYPVWTDNRDGIAMSYASPFVTNNRPRPSNLEVALNESTGQADLSWEYSEEKALEYFIVYRDTTEIGTTSDTTFTNFLPTYGNYTYKVSAMHDDGESMAAAKAVQWGSPSISVTPGSIQDTLMPEHASTKQLFIGNQGQLQLEYDINTIITSKKYGTKDYCDASGGCDEYISRVVFGDIDNSSTCNNYEDFTNLSTIVNTGLTYPITVENGNMWDSDDLGVWIDWNQDGDFEDPGENVVCEADNGGQGTYDIDVPQDAIPGQTVMRVRIKYSGDDCGSPCGATSYGEVEDYTVNVLGWLALDSYGGTVNAGNTNTHQVQFDAHNLTPGLYEANLEISSNDTELPMVSIPVSLLVDGNAVLCAEPYANPQQICESDTSTIYANVNGGSGTYTYSWTSDPAGFSSDQPEIPVTPNETTTYTLEANDGTNSVTASTTVEVMEEVGIPSLPEGPLYIDDDSLNSTYTVADLPNATSYQWTLTPDEAGFISGMGNIGLVNWADDFIGNAYVSVRGMNICHIGEYSEELEVEVIENLAIPAKENSIDVKIYPNPNKGAFVLELNSKLEADVNINIYNTIGEVVYQKSNWGIWAKNSTLISIEDKPAGAYFLHINSKDVNQIYKVMIQK